MTMIADRLPVVDTDSHISEPRDLWTSRLAKKWQDIAPRVERVDSIDFPDHEKQDVWVMGSRKFYSAWEMSWAGWGDYWPKHPPIFELVDPAAYDATARAKKLDEFGIRAQVLYPNILAFYMPVLLSTGTDAEFHLDVVRAYNDFLLDFANEAPGRFIPIMVPPFWDVQESIKEVERCVSMGHKGVLFAPEPEKMGMPMLRDPAWHPFFAAVQDAGVPLNFHAGVASLPDWAVDAMKPGGEAKSDIVRLRTDLVKMSALSFLANAGPIAEVICSGICHDFPDLQFVSVESGFGYVPYLLNLCDWQFLSYGNNIPHPEYLIPSEYFKRQVTCTFWFEDETITRLADMYPDNVMFETDFPHPTCMAPGPVSISDAPRDMIERNLSKLPEPLLRKILFETAARLYKLDLA